MRRRLLVSTCLIALAAVVVLGVPLGLAGSALLRSRAEMRIERRADEVAIRLAVLRAQGRPADRAAIADVLQHNWVRWGSSSFAAAFLTQFTGEVPFAHIDIAGPSWNDGSAWGDQPAGGTGFGVRTLVQCVADVAEAAAANA